MLQHVRHILIWAIAQFFWMMRNTLIEISSRKFHRKETPFFDEKLTFIYGLIPFNKVENCFEIIVFLFSKIMPWIQFLKAESHPDFIQEFNQIKQICKGSGVIYEIYPYNQKLNKLAAIETFLIGFFWGICIGIFASFSIYLITLKSLWFFVVIASITLTFLVSVIVSFIVCGIFAHTRFSFLEYLSKNTCYLITKTKVYHIFRSWDYFGKVIEVPEVQIFEIKGLWQPSFRIPESYKYCKTNAAIVKFYINDVNYIEKIKQLENLAIQGHNNYQNRSFPFKIQKFPNDFGCETAPFYIYLVESYVEVSDSLNNWSEQLRRKR